MPATSRTQLRLFGRPSQLCAFAQANGGVGADDDSIFEDEGEDD